MTNSPNTEEVLEGFDSRHELATLNRLELDLVPLKGIVTELTEHCIHDDMVSTLIDWAVHLKQRDELNWKQAFEAAGIALFG
jgi:hypothetical protein